VANYLTHTGPLLFTGDLNDTPDSPTANRFVLNGFQDTGARHAPQPTLGNFRIDYIFAKAVTVTSGKVIDPGYSDHRAIVMNIQV
jgi:endonuclease/exonuclease/phosphatase (EEP) superfamily protein YafD